MKYDTQTGRGIMEKYLGRRDDLVTRFEHSKTVGDFCLRVAKKVGEMTSELRLDVELCGFLGYVHDIGYSVAPRTHESETIRILQEKEGVEEGIAKKTMHGFNGEGDDCLPRGMEGIILNYSDMSVLNGNPVTLRERFDDSKRRMEANEDLAPETRKSISEVIERAFPRFQRYEIIVLMLAGVKSVKDF